jgi:hypothetical protein
MKDLLIKDRVVYINQTIMYRYLTQTNITLKEETYRLTSIMV